MGRRTAVLYTPASLPAPIIFRFGHVWYIHAGCESSCRTEIHAGHDSMANPAETFPQRSFGGYTALLATVDSLLLAMQFPGSRHATTCRRGNAISTRWRVTRAKWAVFFSFFPWL